MGLRCSAHLVHVVLAVVDVLQWTWTAHISALNFSACRSVAVQPANVATATTLYTTWQATRVQLAIMWLVSNKNLVCSISWHLLDNLAQEHTPTAWQGPRSTEGMACNQQKGRIHLVLLDHAAPLFQPELNTHWAAADPEPVIMCRLQPLSTPGSRTMRTRYLVTLSVLVSHQTYSVPACSASFQNHGRQKQNKHSIPFGYYAVDSRCCNIQVGFKQGSTGSIANANIAIAVLSIKPNSAPDHATK
jgi:hypothetical protein